MFFTHDAQPMTAHAGGVTFVSRLGPRALDGMIAAAAEMALADGRAEAVERRSLLKFLKQEKLLVSSGRSETTRRFVMEMDRVTEKAAPADQTGHADRWLHLTNRLRPLAGMEAARLIAAAAAEVAVADGVVHPEEIALLTSLHRALDLEPVMMDERS